MRLTVNYLTQMKRSAGCSMEIVESPNDVKLGGFLRTLADRHDNAFRVSLLDDAGEPRKSLLLFVGDEHADLARALSDGDTVTILAPMAGG